MLLKSFSLSIYLWSFLSSLFWCLIVVQSVVCNHYRYLCDGIHLSCWAQSLWRSECSQLEATFLRNKCTTENLNCFYFFGQCYSVYKTKTRSLLLFPGLNSLCSKIFTILFLISTLSQKFDQMFFLVQLPWTLLVLCFHLTGCIFFNLSCWQLWNYLILTLSWNN